MNFEQIGGKIAKSQLKRPYSYLFVALIVSILFAPGIYFMFLNIEPSIEKVLPQDTAEIQYMNDMRSQYGADMLYVLMSTDEMLSDVRNPESLKYLYGISEKLRTREHIIYVESIVDVALENNGGEIPSSYLDSKNIFSLDPRTPFYINRDYSKTILRITTDTGSESKIVGATMDSIVEDINSMDAINPGYSFVITGFGAIDRATYGIIISDFIKIMAYSFALMLVFLYLYYGKSVKKTIYTILVIMFALLWTLGLTGYLNITITVVTMVAAAMIMALGISYGIHTVLRYFELREKKNVSESILEMQKELFRAMLGSSLTTSAGFIALLFGVMPAMKNLGIILAFGILITFIVTIFVEPVIFILFDKDNSKMKLG